MTGFENDRMEELVTHGDPHVSEIRSVVGEIVRLTNPTRIYLYNQKFGLSGGTTAFKLCVVGPFPDRQQTERDIYLHVDSDVPFDVILYTCEEWNDLCGDIDSFARKIMATGKIVYGQA